MNIKYIKENLNKQPNSEEEFLGEFKKMCEAFDVTFIKEYRYKTMTEFLLELFLAMMKYYREN